VADLEALPDRSDQEDVPLDTEGITLRAQGRRSQPAGGTLDDGGRAGLKP
jgi:hypothetical protein